MKTILFIAAIALTNLLVRAERVEHAEGPAPKAKVGASSDDKKNCPECAAVKMWASDRAATTGLPATWGQEIVGGDLAIKSLNEFKAKKPAPVPVFLHANDYFNEHTSFKMTPADRSSLGTLNWKLPVDSVKRKRDGTFAANLISRQSPKGSYFGIGANAEITFFRASGASESALDEALEQKKHRLVNYVGLGAQTHLIKRLAKDDRIVVVAGGPHGFMPLDEALVDDNTSAVVVGGLSPLGFPDSRTPASDPGDFTIFAPGVGVNSIDGSDDGAKPKSVSPSQDPPIVSPDVNRLAAQALTTGAISNLLSLVPGLSTKEVKQLLKKTAVPLPASQMLNALKLVEVGKRLSLMESDAERKKALGGRSLYDFTAEAKAALEEGDRAYQLGCDEEANSYYRKAWLLAPEGVIGTKAREQLVKIYSGSRNRTTMADFLRAYDPSTRKATMDKYGNRPGFDGELAASARLLINHFKPASSAEGIEVAKQQLRTAKFGMERVAVARFLGADKVGGERFLRENFNESFPEAILGFDPAGEREFRQLRKIYDEKPEARARVMMSASLLGKEGSKFLEGLMGEKDFNLFTLVSNLNRFSREDAYPLVDKILDLPGAGAYRYEIANLVRKWGDSAESRKVIEKILSKSDSAEMVGSAVLLTDVLTPEAATQLAGRFAPALLRKFSYRSTEDPVPPGDVRHAKESFVRESIVNLIPRLTDGGRKAFGESILKEVFEARDPRETFGVRSAAIRAAIKLGSPLGRDLLMAPATAQAAQPKGKREGKETDFDALMERRMVAGEFASIEPDKFKVYAPVVKKMMEQEESDQWVIDSLLRSLLHLNSREVDLAILGKDGREYFELERDRLKEAVRPDPVSLKKVEALLAKTKWSEK